MKKQRGKRKSIKAWLLIDYDGKFISAHISKRRQLILKKVFGRIPRPLKLIPCKLSWMTLTLKENGRKL